MINIFVLFTFLRSFWSALQKYNISQTKKCFVKPVGGFVYQLMKT